jgi:hypothetical protein
MTRIRLPGDSSDRWRELGKPSRIKAVAEAGLDREGHDSRQELAVKKWDLQFDPMQVDIFEM